MTAVTQATIYSQPYNEIFLIIDNRTYVVDPRDATGGRKFVYDSEPFHKAIDFSNFPYIYVMMPVLVQTNHSANSKYKNLNYEQNVIVRTVKGGSGGSRDDAGRTDMQQIVDDLIETFNSDDVNAVLHTVRIRNMDIEVLSSDTGVVDQKNIYETELLLTYGMRFQVSD